MFTWIIQNFATIIISAMLALVLAAITIKIIRDRKKGKSSCGNGCGHCPISDSCRKS